MRTIYVSPEFPLNRRMRKDVRRGKLQVIREGGERSPLGGGIPSGKGRGLRTTGSRLVCMADNGAEVGGQLGGGHDVYPKEIYIYCPFDKAKCILQHRGFSLKSRKDFNDPFDGEFIPQWPDDKALCQRIKEMHGENAPKSELDARCQEALANKEKYPDGDVPGLTKFVDNIGIVCFSEIRDSILMWAHYADKHEGVCIGFYPEIMFKFFQEFFQGKGIQCELGRVCYSDNFPCWEPGETRNNPLFSKAFDWKYEKEWRFIATDCAEIFLRFPQRIFSSVIFGANILEEKKNRIIKIIHAEGYDIEWWKAKMMPQKYGLEISRCE